jgi:TonB family protein
MNRLILFALIQTVVSLNVCAQKAYYDREDKPANADNCYYFTLKKEKYAKIDTLKTYYCPGDRLKSVTVVDENGYRNGPSVEYYDNGTLMLKGQYEQFAPVGKFTKWYRNGQMKIEQYIGKEDEPDQLLNYWDSTGTQLVKNGHGFCRCVLDVLNSTDIVEHGRILYGVRDSTWTGYRKGGEKYFIETYAEGKLIEGVSYDSLGSGHFYTEIYQTAKPRNGMESFYGHIGRTIRYPPVAKRKRIQGKVFVEFIVEKDGSLSNVKTIRGIGGGCDEAAEETVRSSPRWIAGRHRGQLVRQKMVLPISFKLG